jgi:hypothetical protein
MGSVDFKDLDEVPEGTASSIGELAKNAAHLAKLLRADGYPAE